MSLKLVTHQEDESQYIASLASGGDQGVVDQELGHGTKIIKELTAPWHNAQGPSRTVCADSYFASMATVLELKRCGLNFI